ncbi:Pentatricopeptide repeat-containing protein At2g27610, variant 2 [Dionaea muscipula]
MVPQWSRLARLQTHQTLKLLRQHHLRFHSRGFSGAQVPSFTPRISRAAGKPLYAPNASRLLDEMPQTDSTHCNHMLFDFSRNNHNVDALSVFFYMCRSGLAVDGSSLSCVLKVCRALGDQYVGKQVHCRCMRLGFVVDVSVSAALIDMYLKTENVNDGMRVFDEMEVRNVVTWTSLIGGYTRNGLMEEALRLLYRMQVEGTNPNAFTFVVVIGGLADNGMVKNGTEVHARIVKNGVHSIAIVGNSLINMYSKFGMIVKAEAVFDYMVDKDEVSWNSMVAGLVMNGLHLEAIELFGRMRLEGIMLTHQIFATVLKACSVLKELSFARLLHSRVMKSGFDSDVNIRTALMVAYSKSYDMDGALSMFKTTELGSQNVVSWTAMINGYLQNGEKEKAVDLFVEMNRIGVRPNDFTYSTILIAHPFVSPVQVHAQVIKTDYQDSPSVGTAVLDAYVKMGNANEAGKVFEKIVNKDIVAWSAMIAGFAQEEDTQGAVNMFLQLLKEGIWPNEFTFSSVINACASPIASAEQGKQFHALSIKSRFSDAVCVSSALVTMYAKRGNIVSANEVFKRQPERDLVSWNSMISGYAQYGDGPKALEVFKEMQSRNMKMDGVTLIAVVSACTHAGLVAEGQKYFDIMVKEHHINPTMEHYACMVDLYGRSGLLDKAMELVNEMPFKAGGKVWRTLLGACCVHRNVELGKLAAEKVILLQPQDPAAYVLLSNLYAACGNWRDRGEVRKLMDKQKLKKETGYSWIEVKNKTYSFLAGDCSHPLADQIYLKLEELSLRLKDAGYKPDTQYVLHDVEEEHKEIILSQHSEKLAIAFGLISTPPGTAIQIVKNLRVCGDCHAVIKLISRLEEREIIVRDSRRFHHFKGGICSCGDFW